MKKVMITAIALILIGTASFAATAPKTTSSIVSVAKTNTVKATTIFGRHHHRKHHRRVNHAAF